MEEIKALQEALKQAQAQDTVHRLSEFNCVELVSKLISEKLVDVLFSSDGRQYITPKQLQLEVGDEIMRSGGRLQIIELPPILMVDMVHIETAVKEVVKKDKTLILLGGEVISRYFLDDIAIEIDESLKERGSASLIELAKQYDLPTEFMTTVIKDRLGKKITGYITSDMLYTQSYLERHEKYVRGIFSARTTPVSISDISNRMSLQQNLAFETVKSLIQESQLRGQVKGQKGDAFYVPAHYLENQKKVVTQFFETNMFIEYSKLEKMQVQPEPKAYIRGLFPNGHSLATAFIHPNLVEQIDSACEEAISNKSWIDVQASAPSFFTDKDITSLFRLLQSFTQFQNETTVFGDRFIVSNEFVDKIMEKLKVDIDERVASGALLATVKLETEPKKQSEQSEQTSSADQTDKKKGKKKGGSNVIVEEEEDDDDWDIPNKKKGKGKKSGAKSSNEPSQSNETSSQNAKGKGKGSQKKGGSEQNQNSITSEIESFISKMDRDIDSDLVPLLAEHLAPKVEEIRRVAIEAATKKVTATVAISKQQREEYTQKLQLLFIDTQLYIHSLSDIQSFDKDSLVQKHLVKTVINELLNVYVEFETLLATGQVVKITTSEQRDEAVGQLEPEIKASLTSCLNCLKDKKFDSFIEEFEKCCRESNFGVKSVDKKQERNHVFAHKMQLIASLEKNEITEPAEVLLVVLSVLFCQVYGSLVSAPGRVIPVLLESLKGKITTPTHTKLTEYHSLLVQQFKSESSETSATLQQLLPSIKQIVSQKDIYV